MVDVLVPQIRLEASGIVPSVRQGKPTSMSDHMRMGLEAQPSRFPKSNRSHRRTLKGRRLLPGLTA
jgi:hypothetical protein